MPDTEILKKFRLTQEKLLSSGNNGFAIGANSDMILEAERFTGKQFPDSYRLFLLLVNGWKKLWRDFTLAGTELYLSGKLMQEYDKRKKEYDLNIRNMSSDKVAEMMKGFNPVFALVFATDWGGRFLMFNWLEMTDEGEPQIVSWNIHTGVEATWPSLFDFLRSI